MADVAAELHDDPLEDVALVASFPDLVLARQQGFAPGRIVRMEHGIGQSYTIAHPHYPGGSRHEHIGLFVVPNEHAADRWRRAYPPTPVAVVGSPAAETTPDRVPDGQLTIAVTFHWDFHLCPESRSAFPWYRSGLDELASRYHVIGTGHPRRTDLGGFGGFYESLGVDYVPSWDDVARRADVLVFDNTSVGYEFASTGRPVVVLDAPWYVASHGLRFWDAADVGPRVSSPDGLVDAVERALSPSRTDVDHRNAALRTVYAFPTGAARRAADAIRSRYLS